MPNPFRRPDRIGRRVYYVCWGLVVYLLVITIYVAVK
jgi:hypothetical protein